MQPKIKINLKRRASDSQEISISGASTPPDEGLVSGVSVATTNASLDQSTGLPKVKKIKLSLGSLKAPSPATDQNSIKETAKKLTKKILEYSISGRVLSDPFLELVDRNEYPDYYQLITMPMSFAEIQSKTNSGAYLNLTNFKNDVLLVFSNCKLYNQPNSGIYKDAVSLQNAFLEMYAKETGEDVNSAKRPKISLSAPKPPTPAAAAAPTPKKSSNSSILYVKPRPTDPLELLFDCVERSDYKTWQDTFDSVVSGPSISNKLVKVELFQNEFTWSLLHAACYYGQIKFVEALIERGANIELEDTWYKGRPFAWATFGGHPKLCRILMDKYKVERDAKNIHGQTAWDLVGDKNLPHWKSLFAEDRKPTVFPPPASKSSRSLPTPNQKSSTTNNNIPISGSQRRAAAAAAANISTYASSKDQQANPNTPTSVAISKTQQQQIQALQLLQQQAQSGGATLGKVYPPPRKPAVQQQQQQATTVNNGRPLQVTAYQAYLSQQRETQPDAALISQMIIKGNDSLFTISLPFDASDPEYGYSGTFITVPKGVTQLHVVLTMANDPFTNAAKGFDMRYTVSGNHGAHVILPAPDGTPVSQHRTEQVPIHSQGSVGQECEFQVLLADALNTVDVAVTATSWGGSDSEIVLGVHQTFCLVVDRL